MSDYIDKINKNNTDYDIKDSAAARSVDGDSSHVQEANQIYTTTSQSQTDEFIFRSSAGSLSINSGDALLDTLYGNTVQTGHTDEVLNATGSFATQGTTVALDKATWRALALANGTYTFSYDGTDWKLADTTVSLATYGLTVSGSVASSDSIVVEYTALVIGTLTIATPTALQATGFNQYDATAGYAHVLGDNQYRIAGTYTTVEFSTTTTGTRTTVTVTDGKFTPEEDGYIFVTGTGNILVALVWSGTMDSEPYAAFATSTITIPTADSSSTALPTAIYGFPSVGLVRDEIDFAGKHYVKRIGHYDYSAANLATVEAMGVPYIYDLTHILYVLAEPVTYTLATATSGAYTVNDYGTEEFTGTTAPVIANITYGNSLVDKLRNLADIQSVGTGLTLGANGELSAAGGEGPTVVQSTGTSTTDVMSQNAVTNLLCVNNDRRNIRISRYANQGASFGTILLSTTDNPILSNAYQSLVINSDLNIEAGIDGVSSYCIAINGKVHNTYGIAIGTKSEVDLRGGIAIGAGAYASRAGEFNIGASKNQDSNKPGFNGTIYRVLGGVHDGQDDHDAATVGQLNALIDAINSAANTNIPHIGS